MSAYTRALLAVILAAVVFLGLFLWLVHGLTCGGTGCPG